MWDMRDDVTVICAYPTRCRQRQTINAYTVIQFLGYTKDMWVTCGLHGGHNTTILTGVHLTIESDLYVFGSKPKSCSGFDRVNVHLLEETPLSIYFRAMDDDVPSLKSLYSSMSVYWYLRYQPIKWAHCWFAGIAVDYDHRRIKLPSQAGHDARISTM